MDLSTLDTLSRLTLAIAIALGFFGAVIVVAALVGTLRTDLPRCRRCGHDLRRFGAVLSRCPECGVELSGGSAVRFGPRRRHPRAAVIGLAVALLAGGLALGGGALRRHVAASSEALARAAAAQRNQSAALQTPWDPSTPLELLSSKVLPRRDASRVSLELVLGVPVDRGDFSPLDSWGIRLTSVQLLGDDGGSGVAVELVGEARSRVEHASGHGEVIVVLADLPALGASREFVLELRGTFSDGKPLHWRYEQVDFERTERRTGESSP